MTHTFLRSPFRLVQCNHSQVQGYSDNRCQDLTKHATSFEHTAAGSRCLPFPAIDLNFGSIHAWQGGETTKQLLYTFRYGLLRIDSLAGPGQDGKRSTILASVLIRHFRRMYI